MNDENPAGFEHEPFSSSLIEKIAFQVVERPNQTALLIGSRKLSYADLGIGAAAIRERLLMDAREGPDPVCVLMEKSAEQVVCFLGVLAAGKCIVPLDPAANDEQLLDILQQIEPRVVMVSRVNVQRCQRLVGEQVQVVCVEDVQPSGEPMSVGQQQIDPDSVCTILFTSGTTGSPKGVTQTHRNWLNAVARFAQSLRMTGNDRLFRPGSFAFAAGMRSLFGALVNGATLVSEDQGDLDRLTSYLASRRVTLMHLPVNVFRLLLMQAASPDSLPQLRAVFVAGDSLKCEDAREFIGRFGAAARLLHALAMTECSAAAEWEVDAALLGDAEHVPLGYPVTDMEILILDQDHQKLAPGESGLLAIRSHYLTPGYWKRPDLNQSVLREDPFGSDARVYIPGDLGRIDANGLLVYLGRRDARVKIQGYQVDPARVSSALSSIDGVRDCAVVVRERGGEKHLLALIVAEGSLRPSWDTLRSQLAQQLPAYMVPNSVWFLDALPRNSHGKLDQARLPEVSLDRPPVATPYRPPSSSLEQQLCEIWQQVFEIEAIGIDDNFFDLGGHSLMAARLAVEISDVVGIAVSMRQVFEVPTVADLAGLIEGMAGVPKTEPARLPEPDNEWGEGEVPLSYAQERLWFVEQLEGETTPYNLPYAWLVRGNLDENALRMALAAIVNRHAVLRTNIRKRDASPIQVVELDVEFELTVLDSPVSGSDSAALDELMRAEAERPFDLERDLMLRASLLRLREPNEFLLLLTLHHIASDAWSMAILLRELQAAYAAGDKHKPQLAPLTYGYSDYARWQRQQLSDRRLADLSDYWRAQLEGLEALELPTDRHRSCRQAYRGRRETFSIEAGLVSRLRGIAQQADVTLHTLLLSAFAVLLSRYARSEDFAIGVPVSGRTETRLEPLIGCFINILVLRLQPKGGQPFSDFMRAVWRTSLEAFDHQEMPFEKLVRALNPNRHLRRAPLVQVLFQHSSQNTGALLLPGLQTTRLRQADERAHYDIEIDLVDHAATIEGSLVYDTELFDAATLARMGRHYRTLLERIATDSETLIGQLDMLDSSERERLLEFSGNMNPPRLGYQTVHARFEHQAEKYPEKVALILADRQQNERQLCYRDLDRRAEQLAQALITKGIRPGNLVGLCLERSVEMISGMLAILKAGAAYVPLDPDYPQSRLEFMLGDCKASLLLTTRSLLSRFSSYSGEYLCLDELELRVSETSARAQLESNGEQLAYLMYTSGSLGKPKAVAVDHAAVLSLVCDADYCRFGADRTFLQFSPISFDAATFEIWGALLHGGTLVLAPSGRHALEQVPAVCREHGVTTAFLTSSLFNRLVDQHLPLLAGLEELLTGGEVLSPRHARKAVVGLPDTAIINGYGPTECTTFTTAYRIPRAYEDEAVPIGRPINSRRVYVLSRDLAPQAIGVPGELCVAGDGLARGYLNRPRLTAQKFIEVELFGRHERLYRTGDLVRWRNDGNLEFLGRLDRQIKLRGHRLEPGEIEQLLRTCEEVSDALVVVDGEAEDQALLAYVLSDGPDTAALPGRLLQYLKPRLPGYMLPEAVVTLERWPLNANGKIDRQALPRPGRAERGADVFIAPQGETELLLAGIWSELMKLERVGRNDNFFELGGHSLMAARLASLVAEVFGVELALRVVLETSTLRELANAIEALQASGAGFVAIEKLAQGEPWVMSFEQEAFWLRSRLDRHSPVHNMQLIQNFEGQLDRAALRRAISKLLERQQGLRLVFPETERSVGVSLVSPSEALQYSDLSGVPEPDCEARIQALAQEQKASRLNPEKGPLLRLLLIGCTENRHVLVLTLHHILGDAQSLAIWQRELRDLYLAELSGLPASLPRLPFQYTDYAAWQRRLLSGQHRERLRAFWEARLEATNPRPGIPTDFQRPATNAGQGRVKLFQISGATMAALRRLARQQQVTPFMLLFSAFVLLLNRFSGESDLCVGVPMANRRQPATEHLIGVFTNIMPVRVVFDEQARFVDLLQTVRRASLAVQAHSELPFTLFQRQLGSMSEQGGNSFFQTLFNWVTELGDSRQTLSSELEIQSDASMSMVDGDERAISNLDNMVMLMSTEEDGIDGYWVYDTALYKHATITALTNDYCRLLDQVLERPEDWLGSFPLAVGQTQNHPLTLVQRDIWFDQILHRELPLYNIGGHVYLPGRIDPERFRRAAALLVRKHDSLRIQLTGKRDGNGVPHQTIVPPFEPRLELHDFSAEDAPVDSAMAWMQRRFVEPFTLQDAPLFRFDLVRTSEQEFYWLMQYHHLVADGWGMALLTRSLGDLYTSLERGVSASLDSPSYLEYLARDQEYAVSQRFTEHRAYWKEQFKTPAEPLLLPRSGNSLPGPSDCQSIRLPRSLYRQIEATAASYQASVFHALIAVLTLYFTRTAKVEELVLGLGGLNRSNARYRNTAGLFASVIPFRIGLDSDASFGELLVQVMKSLRRSYRYQSFPISEINREARPCSAHRQLFDIHLSYERQDYDAQFGEIAAHTEHLLHGSEQTPLMLFVRDIQADQDIRWDFVFNRAYFTPGQIKRMQQHLLHLLRQLVNKPDAKLNTIALAPEAELRKLQAWGEGERVATPNSTLVALFEAQVEHCPQAVAIESGGLRKSYSELNLAANQIAEGLIELGVGPDILVGLICERSIDMLIGLLAILKAGGAYLPIDPALPSARIAYMLQDSGLRVILRQRRLASTLPVVEGARVQLLDPLDSGQGVMLNPRLRAGPDNLAYVNYTSGSTGQPKGVAVEHAALSNLLADMRQRIALKAGEGVLALTTLSFDISALELFLPLICGARIHLITQDTQKDPVALIQYLNRRDIHLAQATPTTWKMVLDAGWQRDHDLTVVSGGEALSSELAAGLLNNCSCLWNCYGPTETTIWSTAWRVPESTDDAISIGTPISNTEVYVLDAQGQPLPTGVSGELYIGGTGLARGYLNRPELTTERFVELTVFGQQRRLYRTGDQAIWRDDGQLLLMGRLDNQVKVRGFRIELGEVESVLESLDGVRQAVVSVYGDSPEDARLVGYVVFEYSHADKDRVQNAEQAFPTAANLRSALADQLPEYMIPAAFVLLDSLPLTANAKIDRNALPAPALDRSAVSNSFVAPRNATEQALVELWQEVLMLTEPPGIHDDFFELGGYSLLSAVLINRIESRFGREVPLQAFFSNPTVAGLGEMLEQEPQCVEEATVPTSPALVESGAARLMSDDLIHKLLSFTGSWEGERTREDSLLIGRHRTGSQVPIFWVFQGGNAFHNLAGQLGDDQPLYGMRSGHLIMDYSEDNIQAMALDYVHELEALCPEGPLFVGGTCQGTMIALAMAQHLQRRGRHVPLLILMNWFFKPQYYPGPVGLIIGRDSEMTNPYLLYHQPERMWQRVWPDHRSVIIPGVHGSYFRPPNLEILAATIRKFCDDALAVPPAVLLPAAALQWSVAVEDIPQRFESGQQYEIRATVTNTSPINWPDGEQVGLVLINQWLDAEGTILVWNDGSANVPALAAGNSVVIALTVVVPDCVGDALLDLRVAEVGHPWFYSAQEPLRLTVKITRTSDADSGASCP